MRRGSFGLASAVLMALVVVTVALATGSAERSDHTTVVRIMTRKVPKLGTIIVNSKGRTLYMFVPDKRKRVTCKGTCARVWPPVKLPSGAKITAGGAAKKSLLSSDPNPVGGRVVTYHGWPLYTYVADRSAGQAKGQALNLNGGLWYVLAPSGALIKTKLSSGGGGGGCSDGDMDGDEGGGAPDDGDGCL
jgi:predicted lipoprotein with Yx(FWY)xxD motif